MKTFTMNELQYNPQFNQFYTAYIECSLWSEEKEDKDITPECLLKMQVDCMKFWLENNFFFKGETEQDWSIHEQAGHDFWLTRNGHGTGFWDRDNFYIYEDSEGTECDAKDYLTAQAQKFGEFNLEITEE